MSSHLGQRAKGRRRQADEASFGTVIDRRKAWLFEQPPEAVASYQHEIFTKAVQRRLAQRLRLSVAENCLSGVTLDAARGHIEARGLERFVLKPDSFRRSTGCVALRVIDDDQTYCIGGRAEPIVNEEWRNGERRSQPFDRGWNPGRSPRIPTGPLWHARSLSFGGPLCLACLARSIHE